MQYDQSGGVVGELSWDEVEQRADAGAVGVLPVGAACKEHGLHLPMQSDWLQAEWLARALASRAGVLVWPTVGYGYYPAFTDYPGSVSISQQTFRDMVSDILRAIHRTGIAHVVIINTGISTSEPLQAAAGTAQPALRVTLANVYEGPHYRRAAQALEQQTAGAHADELETSILAAIDAQCVKRSRARAWTPAHMGASGPFSRDPAAPRYSPAGVWGDPTLASEAKGRRLLDAMLADLLEMIEAPAH